MCSSGGAAQCSAFECLHLLPETTLGTGGQLPGRLHLVKPAPLSVNTCGGSCLVAALAFASGLLCSRHDCIDLLEVGHVCNSEGISAEWTVFLPHAAAFT